MASIHAVKLVETCGISPPPTLAIQHFSLPLTALDMFWLGFSPVESLFFYNEPNTHFSDLVHRLKTSLSLTLQSFYPLAGKLHFSPDTTKPEIQYHHGDSISFLIAQTSSDFDHLSGNHPRDESDFQTLVPPLPVSDSPAPVISLQVTGFPNGGFCIGVSVHHAVADGKTYVHFIKSWAELCRTGGKIPTVIQPPFYDRTALGDFSNLEKLFSGGLSQNTKQKPAMTEPGFVQATFSLSRLELQKLKEVASNKTLKRNEKQEPVCFSSFVVTCAYTWVCCIRTWRIEQKKTGFIFTADCRGRLDPLLPDTYFGNCVASCIANVIMGEDGFSVAAEAIDDAIRGLHGGPLRDAETWIPRLISMAEMRCLSVAGSPRLRVYETDFGWGKPKKVDIVSIRKTRAMALAESRDGEGIEVGIALPTKEMEEFASVFTRGLAELGMSKEG